MVKNRSFRFRSVSVSTVIKYFGIFLVGFYTNVLIKNLFYDDDVCTESKTRVTCCQDGQRYQPRTKFEVIRFDYFNSAYLFSNIEDDTKIGLLGYHKKDLKIKLEESLQKISEKFKSPIKLKLFKHGYRRIEPGWGSDYVIDLTVASKNNASIDSTWRVQFGQPFCDAHIEINKVDMEEKVNFIVAVDKVDSKFRKFLISFSMSFLSSKEKVSLTIVTPTSTGQGSHLKNLISGVKKLYPTAHVRSIFVGSNFSRGSALHAGTKPFSSDSLLFFIDADVIATKDFLYRCRMNAIRHKRVFYPIVFSQYKPEIVIKYSPQGKIRSLQDINKFTGHWVHYGYGMVCLYKEDYDAVGGFDLSITGWGGEDVDLYQKHVVSHLEVFRAMDPGLIHRFHEKQCDRQVLSPRQWEACVGAQVNAFGSKMQLAWKVLTEEKQITHANFSISDD